MPRLTDEEWNEQRLIELSRPDPTRDRNLLWKMTLTTFMWLWMPVTQDYDGCRDWHDWYWRRKCWPCRGRDPSLSGGGDD